MVGSLVINALAAIAGLAAIVFRDKMTDAFFREQPKFFTERASRKSVATGFAVVGAFIAFGAFVGMIQTMLVAARP